METTALQGASFMVCTLHQILLGWSNQAKWDKLGLWYVVGEEKWIQGLFGKP